MFSLNSLNSVTKIFVIAVKGLEPATSCVRDQDATRAAAIESNLWLSDLSDSLNLLNSLGSMKVLLNSGKNSNVIEKITEKY